MKKFGTRVYSVSDFLEWRRNSLLDLSPEFQRRSVWTRAAKSFLIDTVVRGKPMPKVFITQELKDQKNIRTVVDGQQRLRAILEFVAGDFPILSAHNPTYGRMRYDVLPDDVKADILKYEIGVDLLYDTTLADILDIFARINTYSVVLNTQEKLNAKYLGIFKIYAYELGHTYAAYFETGGVLTRKAVSRMAEAQLSSDILVALCDSVQTVKNIERFYKKYENAEDVPPELGLARDTFNNTMSFIGTIYPPEELKETNWSRPHWFYTLFICVANSLVPVGGLEDYPRPEISLKTVGQWRAQLDEISAQYDIFTSDDAPDLPRDFERFIDFSRRRTTDTDARLGRAKFVLDTLAR